MKIYNVIFATQYDGEDTEICVCSYKKREDAIRSCDKAILDEIVDSAYTDDEVSKRLVHNDDGSFVFYHEDSCSNWKFRGSIKETELL